MASRHIVQEALHDLATTFNRPASWVERALDLYTEQLKRIPDGVLLDTVATIVAVQTAMPTIADIRTACQSRASTSGILEKPRGCPDCDGTGARQMAWHRQTQWGLQVTVYAGACSCPKGEVLAPSLQGWEDIRAAWQRDSSTVAVYVSDRDHSPLTALERLGPDNPTVIALQNPTQASAMREPVKRVLGMLKRGRLPEDKRKQAAADWNDEDTTVIPAPEAP